jgi:hypothetical protein
MSSAITVDDDYGFYAGMGGFVIDTLPSGGQEYIPGPPRVTVTARGIYFLALNGIIPEISENFIKDKSKANAFAKTFTILQDAWIVIQCVARLCYQLPITPLEVNTVCHMLRAFATYLFWRSKSLDVEEPTLISGETVPSLYTLTWMVSEISKDYIKNSPKAYKTSEMDSFDPYRHLWGSQPSERAPQKPSEIGLNHIQMGSVHEPGERQVPVVSPEDGKTELTLFPNQIPEGTLF